VPEPVRIAGVDVTAYKLKVTETPSTQPNPMAQMPQRMMRAIYGENPRFYLAERPKGVLVYAFGSREAARKHMEAILSGRAEPLRSAPAVRETLSQLPKSADLVILLDPMQCLAVAMGIQMRMSAPPGAELPPLPPMPSVAPVGWACSLAKDTVRGELVVPIKTIHAFGRSLMGLARPTATQPAEAPAGAP